MHAYPLLGQGGGGWALEISSFWAPNGTRLYIGSMPFHRVQKTLEFLLPLALRMDMHASKTLRTVLYES